MPAICAACLKSIEKGDPFLLEGTEVFHRACARSIAESIGTRRRMAIVQLKQHVLILEQKLHEEKRQRGIDKENADTRIAELREQLDVAQGDARRYRREISDAKGRIHDDSNRIRALEQSNANLQRQRSDLQAEVDRLRAENGRLATEAMRRAKDDLPVIQETDPRDASEIRFSLLEIDKP